MYDAEIDMSRALMLDGNAAAGLLREVFGLEMTVTPTRCAHCGNEGQVGMLWAFVQATGTVLRCPACGSVIMRIVETPHAIYLDAQGAAYLRLERHVAA
jgi:DNA-directed RNA polymerase subunit RPC12/RpoP